MRIVAEQHRTVLAMLMIHASHMVSVEHLIAELWPERPTATARETAQARRLAVAARSTPTAIAW